MYDYSSRCSLLSTSSYQLFGGCSLSCSSVRPCNRSLHKPSMITSDKAIYQQQSPIIGFSELLHLRYNWRAEARC